MFDPCFIRGSDSSFSASWLLLADRGGVAERLASVLRARGERCTLVQAGTQFARHAEDHFEVAPGRKEDQVRLLRLLIGTESQAAAGAGKHGQGSPPLALIHLWNLDTSPPDLLTVDGLAADEAAGSLSLVHLVQAWEEAGGGDSRLWLITRAAWAVTGQEEAVAVSQSLATGLSRSLVAEYPRLGCKSIDLGPADSAEEFQQLCAELLLPNEEDEVALRGPARYVHRYERVPVVQPPEDDKVTRWQGDKVKEESEPSLSPCHLVTLSPCHLPFRLSLDSGGTLDGLALRTLERRSPGPAEVEVEVHAAALNFSDVLKALGLYPGLPEGPVPLGIECSGVVTAVGAQVHEFQPGDRVVALGAFCLASHVILPACFVARLPAVMRFEEAATIPIAFLTAYHALHDQGRLRAGESVLIHSATGGVGLAAVRLARLAGARIFATAGTADKRDLLRTLGIEHVMDSRTLAFADKVQQLTGGRGVDLVLNSLSGDAIGKGLTCLADYGRFLEIGKRDIYANSRVGLLPFRKNLSFIAIDLDRGMRERPETIAAQFQQVFQEFQAGRLSPLPYRVFSIGEAATAFRYMAQGKHLGKVVLTMRGRQPASLLAGSAPSAEERPLCRADGTYLITGGLGGFGLATARWLVEQGARHLVLVGRSGAATPEAHRAVEELRQAGVPGKLARPAVNVVVARADVSQPRELAAVLDQVAAELPPLRGVVHAAMVLSDVSLLNLDRAHLELVVVPKAHGAWNLHLQTRHLPLDFFVCYSSMAAVWGNPGQANYSAANAFLNALAAHRRALGLTGLTVDWGYLSEVGYVAQNEQIRKRFASSGIDSFTPAEALALLGRLLRQGTERAGVLRVNWDRLVLPGGNGRLPARFADLVARATDSHEVAKGNDSSSLARIVNEPDLEGRRRLLLVVLRERVSRILGTTPPQVSIDRPLPSLGMDSLMAVELRNWVEKELRASVPIMELMQAASLSGLADLLLPRLGGPGLPAPAPVPLPAAHAGVPAPSRNGTAVPDGDQAVELLEKLPELSGAEVDSLLSAILAEKDTNDVK